MDIEINNKFKDIECQLERQNTKIDKIEERVYNAETAIKLINTNITYLIKNTDDIKNDIKELKQKREDDHYVKPLENVEKIKFQAIGIIMGILLSAFVGFVLPNLK